MTNKHTVDIQMICLMTGADESMVHCWLRDGLNESEVEHGLYDIREVYIWYRDNIYRPRLEQTVVIDDNGEEMHLDVEAYKIQYEMARAEKYDIRRKNLMEQYVSDGQTREAFYEAAEIVGNLLEGLPDEIAEIAYMKPEALMMTELDDFIRNKLIEVGSMGD